MGVNEFVQIGTKIKRARKNKGYSQKQMAQLCEMPYSTYSNYENNNREPGTEQLEKIINVLGITMDQLFFDTMTPEEYKIYSQKKENSFSVTDGIGAEIIDCYFKLNSDGRTRLVEYAKELTKIPEYQRKE